MKLLLFVSVLMLVLPCRAAIASKKDTVYITVDSTISSDEGITYHYQLVRQNEAGKTVLFSYVSQSVAHDETIWFKQKRLSYVAFVCYDQPTGRQFLLFYDWLSERVYKTDWYDDDATGDQLVKDKVSFEQKMVTIAERGSSVVYTVKLAPVDGDKGAY